MSGLEIALAVLVGGLVVALWSQLREFRKLKRWALQSRLTDPPEASGTWGEVFNALHRHRRAALKRRFALAQLMVRSRRGAQALPYGVAVLDANYRLDWCNEAALVHWEQGSAELPAWDEGHRRLIAEGRRSKVRHPTPAQDALNYPAPHRRANP